MDYDQICSHFDGPSKAAEALGLDDRRSVAAWKGRRVPSKWQVKVEALTGGALKADADARADAAEMARYAKKIAA